MQQIRKKMVLGIAIRVGRGERGAKWKVEFPEPARMIGCLTKKLSIMIMQVQSRDLNDG